MIIWVKNSRLEIVSLQNSEGMASFFLSVRVAVQWSDVITILRLKLVFLLSGNLFSL